MEPLEQTRAFLEELARGYSGLGFWVLSQKEESGAGPFGRVSGAGDQLGELAEYAHRPGVVGADGVRYGGLGGRDVFVGVNPQGRAPEPPRRGTARGAAAWVGVALELDGYKLRHREGAGAGVLRDLGERGLAPTVVVSSGGRDAYHAYWLLDAAVDLVDDRGREECRLLGQRLTQLVEELLGERVDHVYDLARVLRLPGTLNSKHGEPAELVSVGGPRWTAAELDRVLPEAEGGQVGERRALTEQERAGLLGLQGTCPPEWADRRAEALVDRYRRWWDEGRARFAGGRDNAVYQLCRDLNSALIPRGEAVRWAQELVDHVGELDAEGNREPISAAVKVDSAYRHPPQPIPEWMPGNQLPAGEDPLADWRAPDGWELNDDGNARRLVAAAEGRVRYSPRTREWLSWDGFRWVDDPEGLALERLVPGVSDRVVAQLGVVGDDDRKQVLLKWSIRMKDSARTEAMMKRARKLVVVDPGELDADPWLLNTPTGTLDLRTGELERVHDPARLITHLCPTEYDPAAEDARWERALRDALWSEEWGDALLTFFRRYCGYCLTGLTTEKAVLVPYGPTNSGKSTLTEPFYRALGDTAEGGYATSWTSDVVEENPRVNRDEKLNKARGARLVVVGELRRGSRMADNFLKQYSGGDTMDHRALYGQSYSLRPQGKLVMHTNYVPRSADPAVHARLKLLPFLNVPDKLDRGLKPYLDSDPRAHRAILAWAVRGCREWQEDGLGDAPWLAEHLDRYRRESDPIVAFVQDCFVEAEDPAEWSRSVLVAQLYDAWIEDNGGQRSRVGRNTLYAMLAERGYPRKQVPARGGTWRIAGLKLRVDGDHSDSVLRVISAENLGSAEN
ncbi:MAG TPA: phage/plasmid primase, P4 family [Candidatus Methylomirabilis sp.]|nr:phage/plasmid primase, P4 family [Candidatus Methylomirabilis sp.]